MERDIENLVIPQHVALILDGTADGRRREVFREP